MPRAAARSLQLSAQAHRVEDRPRTDDIRVSEDVTFEGLLLSDHVLKGLTEAGFQRPSPIQLRAIPIGRCGVDLIVQAKSGTGKTCVLAVLALEQLTAGPPISRCQTLVLAPTREVAVQVAQVVTAVGAHVPGMSVCSLIGGMPLAQDVANLRRCNVAVGTPGRVRQLVDKGALSTESVRLFVMDEADKLMEDAFIEDLNFIYSTLPSSKQMIALSATYPDRLAELLARYMRSPTFVRLGQKSTALLGIRQYAVRVPHHPLVQYQVKLKLEALLKLLTNVRFTQCLVFSNHQSRAETLCTNLERLGWPSAHLSSALSQERRLQALEQLTSLGCRVLVSTDLAARGVDSPHADLVVHLDVPWDGATYLHRVGRAGRYGSLGAAVALVAAGEEESRLKTVVEAAGVRLLRLEDPGVERDLKTCDVEGWEEFDVKEEDEKGIFDVEGGSEEADGNETKTDSGKPVSDTTAKSTLNGVANMSEIEAKGDHSDITNHSSSNATSNGRETQNDSETTSPLPANTGGRKVLAARRRATPKQSDSVQQEVERMEAEKAWLETEKKRMEDALDGWSQAVKVRASKAGNSSVNGASTSSDHTSSGKKIPYRDRDVIASTPPESQVHQSRGKTGSDSDDSAESDDSYKAMLEAYKRDQQKDRQQQQYGQGDGASSDESGEHRDKGGGCSQGTAAESSSKIADEPTGKATESSSKTSRRLVVKDTPETRALEQNSTKDAASKLARDTAPLKITENSSDDSECGETDAPQIGSKYEDTKREPDVDKSKMRQALAKLNPKEAKSITEDELVILIKYVEFYRGKSAARYREAVEVIGKNHVKDVLSRFGDDEVALSAVMTSLNDDKQVGSVQESENEQAEPPAQSEPIQTVPGQSTQDSVRSKAQSAFDPAAKHTGGGKSDSLSSTEPSHVSGPPDVTGSAHVANSPSAEITSAATRAAVSTDRGATYIGEEIRRMTYVPEEAAAFQRKIRQQAEMEKIRRVAERARARDAAREKVLESSGDDDRACPEQAQLPDIDAKTAKAKGSRRSRKLRHEPSSQHYGDSGSSSNGAPDESTAARGASCIPKQRPREKRGEKEPASAAPREDSDGGQGVDAAAPREDNDGGQGVDAGHAYYWAGYAPNSAGDQYQAPCYVGNQYQTPGNAENQYQTPGYADNQHQAPGYAGNQYQAPGYAGNQYQAPGYAGNQYQTAGYAPQSNTPYHDPAPPWETYGNQSWWPYGWSYPSQYGYSNSAPQYNNPWSQCGGVSGWGGAPQLNGEAWAAMLSKCYQQQTAYITAMSRFYADFYRERHG